MSYVHISDSGPDYWEDRDGEHVTFTPREWREMMADPCYYGYSCPDGHALRDDDPAVIANGCMVCFGLGERANDWIDRDPTPAEMRELDRYAASLRDFPLVACGNCKTHHVGTGAVRRCYANSGRFDR